VPIGPDRILVRTRSFYGSVGGPQAQRSESRGEDRWKGILILLTALIGVLLFAALMWST